MIILQLTLEEAKQVAINMAGQNGKDEQVIFNKANSKYGEEEVDHNLLFRVYIRLADMVEDNIAEKS